MERQNEITKTIEGCKLGGYAQLELCIVKLFREIRVRICSTCWSSECNKSFCGKKQYVDRMMYFYDAIDGNGNRINVVNKPWSTTNLSNLKEGNLYKITGKIEDKLYKEKFDLRVDKIEEIVNFSNHD